MGWGMIDESDWQGNKALSLTCCWSWDEAWWMRVPCKELKKCHSQTVGHGMRYDRWECLTKKYRCVTHFLLVMIWDMIDESAWQRHKAASLTYCWSWDERWLMVVPGTQIKQCHSLPVGHGMRYEWWECMANKLSSVTHFLLVMEWDMINEQAIKQCHSLAVGHSMKHDQCECLAKK